MQSGDAEIVVAGERLVLLPERAVLWPRAGTLLVADTHFGKAAAFRAGGLPVPGGTTAEGLARLDRALDRTGAGRVVFLGDFLHARQGRAPATFQSLGEWQRRRATVDLVLVRGNHDRGAGDPPKEMQIRCVDPPLLEAPFVLAHHPDPAPHGYVLAGHVHPAVLLTGRGRQRARLPCFWFGAWGAVLPAFGGFTGVAEVAPAAGDRVFVVADGEVVEVS
ncbi:MAG: metallophosphoesterase [Gemmatimonadetes bacterium]|nr:metallophosphoesterase [Gemmatimonadota bacterium]